MTELITVESSATAAAPADDVSRRPFTVAPAPEPIAASEMATPVNVAPAPIPIAPRDTQ